ncbi:glycosyltransferase family 4 protein [Actomonas aquatica]|uniref:Glycosyltransferase family 4 protein n=1 Tax=Actomonas aquatica TaxID=2866162 RepID=A0ABZ1C9V5_9BACT|nr:glycosyltransferase family 4 protein [Opitutus sp. WL0086]WRQ88468.1 glycosyltransferase family 4 protein [Opitutus sp. WL0086]
MSTRLAIVSSHPTQYYAPWFSYLSRQEQLELRVFYLWDFGVKAHPDPKFSRSVRWDLDLLNGYQHEFVPNRAKNPGTHHFGGLHNPTLAQQLGAWSPQIVLVFGYGWRSLLNLALQWRQSPLILRGDTHLLGRPRPNRVRTLVLRTLFTRFRSFACVGSANRAFYRAHGVPENRLFDVPHCIDNARFAAATLEEAAAWRRAHGFDAVKPLFLFVGKFEQKKRPDLLLQSFKQSALSDAQLGFLGDGEMKPRLLRATSESDGRIKVLPFHNQSEMPAALRAADCVVLPSQGSGETWGLIVNEAMACGTPALVSDHVGCAADLVIPGKTGWQFPAGNRDALTQSLLEANAAIRTRRDELRASAAAHIQAYSYETAGTALRKMLAEVL